MTDYQLLYEHRIRINLKNDCSSHNTIQSFFKVNLGY